MKQRERIQFKASDKAPQAHHARALKLCRANYAEPSYRSLSLHEALRGERWREKKREPEREREREREREKQREGSQFKAHYKTPHTPHAPALNLAFV